MISRQRMGDIYLLMAVLTWGNTFAAAKFVLTAVPPMTFTAVRYGLAACFLMLILAMRGKVKLPARHELPPMVLLGIMGVTCQQLFWANGLSLTAASKASILAATTPVFSIIISSFLGQKLRAGAWAGIVLSFFGVFLVVNNSITAITVGGGSLAGDLLALSAALSWAVYTAAAPPYIARIGALRLTVWSTLFGALLLLPFILLDVGEVRIEAITAPMLGAFLFTALIAGSLGYLWWYEGIARLGVARSVVYTYVIPLVAVSSSAVFLGEDISMARILGALIVIAGIAITRRLSRPTAAKEA